MMRLNKFSLLFLFLFFSGCVTIQPAFIDKPIMREMVYENKSYDQVWEAAKSVFIKSAGIATTVDKQSGVIGYENNMPTSDMNEFIAEKAPTFPMGTHFGQGQMKINVIISEAGKDKTKVFLKTKIMGSLLNAYGYPIQYNIALTSNGKLEEEFFNKLSAELGVIRYDYLKTGK